MKKTIASFIILILLTICINFSFAASYKTTTALNVRKSASTKGKVMGVLSKGTKINVASISGSWAKITYKGKTCYVHKSYIKEVTTSSTSSTSAATKTGTTSTNLNMRKGASTKYAVITTIPKNKTVNIISSKNGWYKIKYKNYTGYVSGKYIKNIKTVKPSAAVNPLGTSTKLNGKIVILDAGHGGKDPGAVYSGVNEKDLNLKFAKLVKENLERNGATVIMTRTTDVYVDLYQRVSIANKWSLGYMIDNYYIPLLSSKNKAKSDKQEEKSIIEGKISNYEQISIEIYQEEIEGLEQSIVTIDNEISTIITEIDEISTTKNEVDGLSTKMQSVVSNANLASQYYNKDYSETRKITAELAKVFEYQKSSTILNNDAIFVSIHCNATSKGSPQGSQVYYMSNSTNAKYYTKYNTTKRLSLATNLLNDMASSGGFVKDGVYDNNAFAIIRETNLISSLVEIGFMNNKNDLKRLTDTKNQQRIANGIATGIINYFN